MPHVGGGGHFSGGGGFHSFGGHSSSSSTPRFDKHGNLHSSYYIRPGFYYRCHYIPYGHRERRALYYYASSIFLFITAIALIFFAAHIVTLKGEYNESKIEDYGLEQYERVYDKHSNYYEKNILITFVDYENEQAYDYVCINGDEVDWIVDITFGSPDYSDFGRAMKQYMPSKNYRGSLYLNLAKCINQINEKFKPSGYYSFISTRNSENNKKSVTVLNHTSHEYAYGKTYLTQAIDEFYSLTKYNIVFVIDTNENVYSVDWALFALLTSVSVISVLCGIGLIVQKRKNIEFLEEEIKNGNAEKYFEGEDTFEEYCKEHPLDDYSNDDDPFAEYDKNNENIDNFDSF